MLEQEEELAAFAKDVAPGKLGNATARCTHCSVLTRVTAQFEELVKKNLGDKQFLGGDSIVLADLVVFLMGEGFMEGMGWAKVRGWKRVVCVWLLAGVVRNPAGRGGSTCTIAI